MSTAGKYLDADIVATQGGTLSPSSTYYSTSTSGTVSASGLGAGYLSSKYYIKAGTAGAISGGGLSTTANYTGTPTISTTLTYDSTAVIGIMPSMPATEFAIAVDASSSALSGSTTVKRAVASYSITTAG